jgi:hypothetical protein
MTNLKQPVRSTATRRPFEARKSAKQGAPGVRKAGNIESNGGRRERNVCLVVRCNAREWPCKAGGGPPSLRPELLQGSSRDRTACTGRALWEARPSHTDPARSGGGEVTSGGGTRCLTTGQGQLESSTVLVLTCQVSSMWMSSHNDVQLPGCAYSLLQCTPLTYFLNPF